MIEQMWTMRYEKNCTFQKGGRISLLKSSLGCLPTYFTPLHDMLIHVANVRYIEVQSLYV